jgi:hypothetical protein
MQVFTRRLVFMLWLALLLGMSTPAHAAAEAGPPASFAGNWMAVTNDARYAMTLQQVGSTVIGTFTPNNGKMEGTVTDNILRFKWSTGGGTGSGRFVMDKEQMNFHGTYSLGNDPDKAEGFWYGKRTPTSFAGTWKVSGTLAPLIFKIKQDGERATGEFSGENIANTPTSLVRAGVATRNTLRFVATDANGKILGDGEFVMDEGGKSFKGTFLGTAVTGTLADP